MADVIDERTDSWIDLEGSYRLLGGVRVVPRPDGAVQIGTEPPHCWILSDAPPESVPLLRRLDGTLSLAQVVGRSGGDALLWRSIFTDLRRAGLLARVAEWDFAAGDGAARDHERSALVHRHGLADARRRWQRRQDAVVVVRGAGLLADTLTALLSASGVGRLHHLTEAVRPAARADAAALAPPTRDPDLPAAFRPGPRATGRSGPRPTPDQVRSTPPAPGVIPTLIVLADLAPPPPWLVGQLLDQRIPHLAAQARLTSAVLGPLVLPGRSTCLLCVLRHRSERDLGWTLVEAGLRVDPEQSTATLATTVAAAAAVETLTLLDGQEEPASVDGTIEWSAGGLAPRRRSWQPHADCHCVTAAGP